jgi:hypothetical protein
MGKTKSSRIPGTQLRALMEHHRASAAHVAKILNTSINHVQARYQRGISNLAYRVLELELTYRPEKWLPPDRPPLKPLRRSKKKKRNKKP